MFSFQGATISNSRAPQDLTRHDQKMQIMEHLFQVWSNMCYFVPGGLSIKTYWLFGLIENMLQVPLTKTIPQSSFAIFSPCNGKLQ